MNTERLTKARVYFRLINRTNWKEKHLLRNKIPMESSKTIPPQRGAIIATLYKNCSINSRSDTDKKVTKVQKTVMKLAKLSQPMILLSAAYKPLETEIPVKYCIIKNCHNCYRMFHFNFGTEVSRRVCTTMYHQAGCCDFYIKRTKGTLFWSTVSRTQTVSARSQIVDPKI